MQQSFFAFLELHLLFHFTENHHLRTTANFDRCSSSNHIIVPESAIVPIDISGLLNEIKHLNQTFIDVQIHMIHFFETRMKTAR